MLHEFDPVRQVEGEPHRRWFGDSYFDLIVWQNDSGNVVGFQLCYAKGHNERAFTWSAENGFDHRRIDDGENEDDFRKMTPILVPDGVFDSARVSAAFDRAALEIDPGIAEFVHRKILDFGA